MKHTLQQYFGYDSFRPHQESIIQDVLDKKDVLVLMPTGGGKSICYQIPAVMQNGITIVVSPLISLMKDQVEGLNEIGIKAAYLNSTLSSNEQAEVVQQVRDNELSLLYIAPERLFLGNTIELLKQASIDAIAIDEAHCVSEWGHDFRPEYRKLGELRTEFPDANWIALTATATSRVCEDIQEQLSLQDTQLYKSSFNRENLEYKVWEKHDAFLQITDFLDTVKSQSGIIYCYSRKSVDELAARLQNAGFAALPYHAGLDEKTRAENQEKFIKDDVDIIVATVAFGMGIDKPNVRFVIHQDMPSSIERYYQETGRAGRDGLPSVCILLYSYADKAKIEYFIDQKSASEQEVAKKQLQSMLNFAEAKTCRRNEILAYFDEDTRFENCESCDICLNPPEIFNATEISQKILSCVIRTGERFGANYVAQVLTGSRAKQIKQNKHDQLSTYNIAGKYSKKQVNLFIRELIADNYLAVTNDRFPTVSVTEKGMNALSDRAQIQLRKPREETKTRNQQQQDSVLFEILRTLRKELADERGIPPYQIFSDATLKEMAEVRPTNRETFAHLKGVGSKKLATFGKQFVDAIVEYEAKRKERAKKPLKMTDTLALTHELLKKGIPVEEIAEEREYVIGTIYDHIGKLYLLGETINIEHYISKEKQEKIAAAIKKIDSEKLTPIKEALGEGFEYWEIRLVMAMEEKNTLNNTNNE